MNPLSNEMVEALKEYYSSLKLIKNEIMKDFVYGLDKKRYQEAASSWWDK